MRRACCSGEYCFEISITVHQKKPGPTTRSRIQRHLAIQILLLAVWLTIVTKKRLRPFEGRVNVTESILVRDVNVADRIRNLEQELERLRARVEAYLPPLAEMQVQRIGSGRGTSLFQVTGSRFRPNAPIRINVPNHSPQVVTADPFGNLNSQVQIACNPGDKLHFTTFDSGFLIGGLTTLRLTAEPGIND
jgi:hypothetical protein